MGADLSQAKPESVEVGKYACDLIIEEMWKEIRTKEDKKEDEKKKVPTAGGRRIPSPLQDMTEDTNAPDAKMEQSPEAVPPQLCWPQTPQSPVAPPPMMGHYMAGMAGMAGAPPTFADNFGSFNAGFAAGFANTMGGMGNPNAFGHLGHLGYTGPAWPPMQQLGPVLGNAATNGYANQAALYGGGYGPYNGYGHFSSSAWQGGCHWGLPQGQGDMRQAYFPQATAAQWTGGGQAFFQPFSTQPPMQPAVQQFPPPPAYPPQHMGCGRAPLTAQFSNGPLLNTQPWQQPAAPAPAAYPMPMRPPAPPAMPPAHAAPPAPAPVAPTAPPMAPTVAPTVAPTHPSPAMPPSGPPTQIPTLPAAMPKRTASPVNATKEERRLAAQEVLREQRLLFQVLARGEDVAEHRSEASTAVTTPGSSEKKPTVEVHEEEAPVAVIEQKNRGGQEVKPPTPQKKPPSPQKKPQSPQKKPPTPQKKPQQPQEKAQWQPKLDNKQGGNKGAGSKGVNQVWVAKEEKGSTGNGAGNGRKGKGKGKGKNTTEQWRVKQDAQQEASTTRQINQRGKKSQRNTYSYYGF